DLDAGAIPDDPAPTAVVESSPGRYHAWWRLTQPIAPARAEALNKRIARLCGGDPSGADLTQLLRLPGYANRKYANLPRTRLVEIRDAAHDPAELEQRLPPLAGDEPRDAPCGDSDGDATAQLAPIVAGCAWLRHCRDDAATLSEPEWYGMLSI